MPDKQYPMKLQEAVIACRNRIFSGPSLQWDLYVRFPDGMIRVKDIQYPAYFYGLELDKPIRVLLYNGIWMSVYRSDHEFYVFIVGHEND